MKKWFNVLAVTVAMLLGSHAMAADDAAKPVRGKVTAVAKDTADAKLTDITVTVKGTNGAADTEVIVKADDSTKVTKGKDTAALSDVTVGVNVSVNVDADKKAKDITIRAGKKKPA